MPQGIPTRRQAYATLLLTVATIAVSVGLLTAVAIVHPPLAVLPLVALVCIGCPLVMAWSVPTAVAVLRTKTLDERALSALRRSLDRLPETEHPLGL
jgi:hypothetical protein